MISQWVLVKQENNIYGNEIVYGEINNNEPIMDNMTLWNTTSI